MTVAELIDVLKKMPQDSIVKCMSNDYGGIAYWCPVDEVFHDEYNDVVQITGNF